MLFFKQIQQKCDERKPVVSCISSWVKLSVSLFGTRVFVNRFLIKWWLFFSDGRLMMIKRPSSLSLFRTTQKTQKTCIQFWL